MTTDRMTPTTRLNLDIEVLIDDQWVDGTLEHWRRTGDHWQGFVRYTIDVGQTHIGWYDHPAEIRRPTDEDGERPPGTLDPGQGS